WYAVLAPITTSPGRRSGLRPPAIPVKRTWVGWNCSTSRVAAVAAFTFPIPEWASTTLLSFKLPVVNRIPWTVISFLSVSSWPSVSIYTVIALRTAVTRVAGAGRGVLPTWATLAAGSSRTRKERTQSDLRIGLIVVPYFLAPANDNSRLAANCLANAFLAQEALIFNGIIFIICAFVHAFQDKILIL